MIDNKSGENELNLSDGDTQLTESGTEPLHLPQEQEWQSLSPIAIAYFIASNLKSILSSWIYFIPVIALNYKTVMQHPYIWVPSVLGLLLLLCLLAIVSFKVYRFRLTGSNVEIRSGVINKKHLNLPFERVQNVKIEQPLYYRISGHACLQLDTAGSAKNEAKIIALKRDVAEQLKVSILSKAKTNSPATSDTDTNKADQDLSSQQELTLNRRSLGDLVIHGITSNRIWIFLGGLAPFFDDIVNSAGNWGKHLGLDFSSMFSLQTHSILEVGIYAVSLTLLIFLILVSFSVLGSIISFYDYRLSRLDDRYIRRSGLLTKHEVTMRLSRLQMIIRKQDWLDVLLKRINLKFEQNNATHSQPGEASAVSNKIIVPSIKEHECQALINNAYPDNTLSKIIQNQQFRPINKYFLVRNIGYCWFPIWVVLSILCWYQDKPWLVLVASIGFVLSAVLVFLRWKRWGYATDKQFVYVRKGLIGVDYYCFPIFKLQQVKFLQTLLMHRKQLASVKFILASGAIKVPFINETAAYGLIDTSLYHVESSNKSWM